MKLTDIRHLIANGQKIEAIKGVRNSGIQYDECPHGFAGTSHNYTVNDRGAWCPGTGLGLKDAKEIVEILMGTHCAVPREQAYPSADIAITAGFERRQLQERVGNLLNENDKLANRLDQANDSADEWSNKYSQERDRTDALEARVRKLEAYIIDMLLTTAPA